MRPPRSPPLRDHLKAEGLGKGDDRPDDREIPGVGAQFPDEDGIDLEGVDRQILQVRQDGISGAEVVYRDLHPGFTQFGEGPPGGLDVLHHCAFGDLEAE